MLDSHRLQIERAEIQNKLNNDRLIEIRSTDADAEVRSGERKALTEQMNGVNERLIVALQQEDIETQMVTAKHVDMGSDIWTPELRELRTIAQKAEFRHYVASSISETPLQGEAREYNEQMLVSWAPGEFPIEKLLDPVEDFKPSELIGYKVADKSVEERAAIGGTFSNVGTVTWASRLFQSSEALYMGAQMPVVGTGRQDYPIIAGTDVGSAYAAGAAETAGGSITIVTARPERLQKTYEYDMVNELEIPGIANALAPDLRGGLMEANDAQGCYRPARRNQPVHPGCEHRQGNLCQLPEPVWVGSGRQSGLRCAGRKGVGGNSDTGFHKLLFPAHQSVNRQHRPLVYDAGRLPLQGERLGAYSGTGQRKQRPGRAFLWQPWPWSTD